MRRDFSGRCGLLAVTTWAVLTCVWSAHSPLASRANAQEVQAGKRYALVVGVKTYRVGQPLPPLEFTENDAQGLADVLTKGGYAVTLMTQTEGRTEGKESRTPLADYIRDQLETIVSNPFLKADDTVLVAFAGHGVKYDVLTEDPATKLSQKTGEKFYFCPADADIAKLATAADVTERNRLLDLVEIYKALGDCKAGSKVLLVDACRFDPTKPAENRAASIMLPPLPSPPGGAVAYFSCSPNQLAIEDKTLKHGVFFHHVIQALKGDADTGTQTRPADGQITLSELTEHVSRGTYDFVSTKYSRRQTPEVKGEMRLSFPLIEVPKRRPELLVAPFSPTEANSARTGWARALNLPEKVRTKTEGEMLLIPPGEFQMGSDDTPESLKRDGFVIIDEIAAYLRTGEERKHKVRLTKPFYLGRYEVTLGEFLRFYHAAKYKCESERDGKGCWGYSKTDRKFSQETKYAPWSWGHEDQTLLHPVTNITWNDAVAYCEWLSKEEGKRYRLPTEAEWEYACRAGTTGHFFTGNTDASLNGFANLQDAMNEKMFPWLDFVRFRRLPFDDGYALTAPVGQFRANAFGLHDMHGNVWEWCADWDGEEYYKTSPVENPSGGTTGSGRVYRGGGWINNAPDSRSAMRGASPPSYRGYAIGFRLAMSPAE